MKTLALVFANPVRYGGHVSFTTNLQRGLISAGQHAKIVVPHHRTESSSRNFGYDTTYTNMTPADILDNFDRVLVVAPSKPKREQIDQLLVGGARIVIHDPAEFKHGWNVALAEKRRPIVIRKTMIDQVNRSTFIPHPYERIFSDNEVHKRSIAISTSRIDFDKHTEILLDANRLLRKPLKISIRGFENRIYTRFNIMPKYPEWTQSEAAYERKFGAGAALCGPYHLMCDMSVIRNDGGGTQYTFLEAMDAGAVCVLNSKWILKNDVMKSEVNCLSVGDGNELATLIRKVSKKDAATMSLIEQCRGNGYKLLRRHSAIVIARQYVEALKL